MSAREASRVFGVRRDPVRTMLANATPQGYTRRRPPRKPKIEPFTGIIDAILDADRHVPGKQRHTVKRIFERLRYEHGFEGRPLRLDLDLYPHLLQDSVQTTRADDYLTLLSVRRAA